MFRTARFWKGAGTLTLGGLVLSGALARAGDDLTVQLLKLAQQAAAQGQIADASNFYRQVLKRDPANVEAKRFLLSKKVVRVGLQDPKADEPDRAQADRPNVRAAEAEDAARTDALKAEAEAETKPAPVPRATLETASEIARVQQQRVVADVKAQLKLAREQARAGYPDAARETLRLAQNLLQSDGGTADEIVRSQLDRDIKTEYRSLLRLEEQLAQDRAQALQKQGMAIQQEAALTDMNDKDEKAHALMVTFNTLMAEGTYNVLYNGGMGDIDAIIAPFYDAYTVAKQARATNPRALSPHAGMQYAQASGFLAQTLSYEELKEFRFMSTMEDVDRASVPFPDTQVIEYPNVEKFKILSEKRIKKYEASYLTNTDPKTQQILNKLDQEVNIPFEQETPLEDVIKYIKQATSTGPGDPGIPIYVDPESLQGVDKTLQSPITLNLEGVKLKTALKLILNQLGLTYSVHEGLLSITAPDDKQQLETRIYPVADLAIIPIALLGFGGGMGGGMMGGMGGGMGGMGGGMGMMGGMMSVPASDPTSADPLFAPQAPSQKKSARN